MLQSTRGSLDWSRDGIEISRVSDENRTGTILVADADPDLREIYRTALEFHGHRVVVATDGLQALEIVRSVKPDVALLDTDLPHLNGLEAARLLRGSAATVGTAVILLSLYVGGQYQMRALRAGCAGYLPKPFDPRELLREVRRAMAMLKPSVTSPAPAPAA